MSFILLRRSQTVLRAALWFHMLLIAFWVSMTIVRGFGYYDASPPASFNVISHVGFWALIEVFVLGIGFMASTFDVDVNAKNFHLAQARTIEFLTLWTIILVGGIGANIVHLVASALELSDCRSTLCMLNSGFLIAMMVVLGFLICLEILEIYIVFVYKKRLRRKIQ